MISERERGQRDRGREGQRDRGIEGQRDGQGLLETARDRDG